VPFGGFCPLPLRLGPDGERGWSAAEQSRFAADLLANSRTQPLAQLRVRTSTGQVLAYSAQPHTGISFAPVMTELGTGHFAFDWLRAYQDWDESYLGWKLYAVIASADDSSPIAVVAEVNTDHDLEIRCRQLLAATPIAPVVTITVWGEWLPERQIGSYDGATDKADSLTEGDSSYCYDWFVELQAMRGSAYSMSLGNVDAENFAMARQFGALNRAAEKLEANSLPGTSDEKLENWVKILGVSTRASDQRWQIRQRCEAKFKAAASESLPTDIDAAIRDLLGDSFVEIHRTTGADLDNPPPGTRWPSVDPGTDSYSLGGGAWFSERSFLWIEVVQPIGLAGSEFSRMMDVDLFELLDLRLPAHMTFNWATSDGFLVGISQLGFAAL
jgi:hypothetical protein